MPTVEQLQEEEAVVESYRARIGKRCRIVIVVPDYFEKRPKKCMNGWGSVFLGVAPDGAALPCHAVRMLPGLQLPNVVNESLHDIWYSSDAFRTFGAQTGCRSPVVPAANVRRTWLVGAAAKPIYWAARLAAQIRSPIRRLITPHYRR